MIKLEDLCFGNQITSSRIVLEEDESKSDEINFELIPKRDKWYEFFTKLNRRIQSQERFFKGENEDFEVEYSYVEVPIRNGHSTRLCGEDSLNTRGKKRVLNDLNLKFKEVLLPQESFDNLTSRECEEYSKAKFIYGEGVGEFIEPSRNLSISCREISSPLLLVDAPSTIRTPDLSYLTKNLNLGLMDMSDYERFVENHPNLENLFSSEGEEDLFHLRRKLAFSTLGYVSSQINEDFIGRENLDLFLKYSKYSIAKGHTYF